MSVITNYVPLTGSPITTPADFARAWAPSSINPTTVTTLLSTFDTTNDAYITQGKYNLNNIVALSTTDLFGASGHLSTLSTIWNTIDTQVGDAFDDLVTYTNMAGEFTDINTSKFDTIQAGINQIRNNLISIKSSVDSLKTSVITTYNGLAVNVPTTAAYNAAKTNYQMVISSLTAMSNRLEVGITYTDFSGIIYGFKSNVNDYLDPDGAQDASSYMNSMNERMSYFLFVDTYLYTKLYIFKRVRGIMF